MFYHSVTHGLGFFICLTKLPCIIILSLHCVYVVPGTIHAFSWKRFFLRASSYEPGQPGWLSFRDLALPLFSLQKYQCVHMGPYERPGWLGYRDLGFCDQDSVTGKKIFLYEHSSPVTGTKLFKQNSFALTT